jgi:hypothetical protein
MGGRYICAGRPLNGSESLLLSLECSRPQKIVAIAALITHGGSVKKGSKRKQRAVRMLQHAVRLATPIAEASMSDTANGRLASSLRKNVHLLKVLMRDDPEDMFWSSLQKTILNLVKFILRTRC